MLGSSPDFCCARPLLSILPPDSRWTTAGIRPELAQSPDFELGFPKQTPCEWLNCNIRFAAATESRSDQVWQEGGSLHTSKVLVHDFSSGASVVLLESVRVRNQHCPVYDSREERCQLTYFHTPCSGRRWCYPHRHLLVAPRTRSFPLRDIFHILWRCGVCFRGPLT